MTLQWQLAPLNTEETKVANLNAWLCFAGSFMTRLRAHGVKEPAVRVIAEGYCVPSRLEANLLGLKPRQVALIREVEIASVEGQWMYAKTIVPLATLTGQEKRLAHLKNKSLGSFLFKDPHLVRTPFTFSTIEKDTSLYQALHHKMSIAEGVIHARRSFFYASSKPILLLEFFLPDMISLC